MADVIVDLGPLLAEFTNLRRGDARTLTMTVHQITQAWLDANPDPSDDELEDADTEPIDFTDYTTRCVLQDEKEATENLLSLETSFPDAPAGKVSVVIQVDDEHPAKTWLHWDVTPLDGEPFTIVEGNLKVHGLRLAS